MLCVSNFCVSVILWRDHFSIPLLYFFRMEVFVFVLCYIWNVINFSFLNLFWVPWKWNGIVKSQYICSWSSWARACWFKLRLRAFCPTTQINWKIYQIKPKEFVIFSWNYTRKKEKQRATFSALIIIIIIHPKYFFVSDWLKSHA